MDNSKKPWESKTIVINFVLGVLIAILPFVPAAHVVSDWINANGALIAVAWSGLAIVLRFLTKDAIVLTD